MATYKLIATVPTYLTFEVEADSLAAAVAAVNEDFVDYTEKFSDYDSSVLELISVDGEPV